ncbi:MAG: preprotein translocase subunit SecY, partial [Gammaproteobacteria bacterium]
MAKRTKLTSPAAPSAGPSQELKHRLLFVLGAIVVFRIGSFIPVPGINSAVLAELFEQQRGTIIDMVNMFSGGALSRFSLFAIGVMPYISASIIMQLLSHVEPKLKELRKEGEQGRRTITRWTRYATVVLATFQAYGVAIALEAQSAGGSGVVLDPGWGFRITTVASLVTGTVFLMWLGEQISERGIGNGISILIFAGIVSGLPQAIFGTLELARTGEIHVLLVLVLLVLAVSVTAFVVFVERGQRRITVNYAKRQVGRKMYGGQTSHLPLKLNMAGVIPPIFASSIILFPATLGGWFGESTGMGWLRDLSTTMQPGQPIYTLMYGGMIVFFCFFYTALVFDPKDTADNLKKSGAFIPGIRPGEQTSRYIDGV